MSDERRTPERNSVVGGAEPELVVRYRDPISQATGYVVVDTLSTGAAFGGVRISPRVSWVDLAPLARSGTIRYQLSRVSLGGAKLGLEYDPEAPDLDDVLGRFLSANRALLEHQISIGPDLHCSEERLERVLAKRNLPWRMAAVQRAQGWPKERWLAYERLLAEPVGAGTFRDLLVPYGAAQAVATMGEFLFQRKQTVGVIGAGPLGRRIAQLLQKLGATVVAVGGGAAGIYAPAGLMPQVLEDTGYRMSLDQHHLYVTHDELFALPLDALVLAGAPNAVTIDNVGKVRAALVVEVAARSVTFSAEKVLVARGSPVLPSFATTMGAVLIAKAVLAGDELTPEKAMAILGDQVSTTVRELARLSATLGISLRDAGTRLAFHRLEAPLPSVPEPPIEAAEEEPPEAL